MPTTHEIRQCESCGLRYPVPAGHDFGVRCPICMGNTRLILRRSLIADPKPDRPTNAHPPRAILLDNIRSAWNVGSIFRSADGFGFAQAYLCGITPTPEKEAVRKTSLGAEETVPWSYHKDAVKLIHELKKDGWTVSALEEDARAIDIRRHAQPDSKSILILGNEITGVDPELLDVCDAILYIPMRGEKKSFNVAMAFSIAAYQMQK